MRYIPLLYTATDFDSKNYGNIQVRNLISQYINCGKGSPDVYGMNIYTWCSTQSTYENFSTYALVTHDYETYRIPMIFSEFGCTAGNFESRYPFTENQRTWKQVSTLFGPQMSDVWSGGIAYEYSMTTNNYGLVLLLNNRTDIVRLENYNNLKQEYKNVHSTQNGSWTDKNICKWVPPIASTPFRVDCPDHDTIQNLFQVVGITSKENWINSPLPPNPIGLKGNVTCGEYPLSIIEKQENKCQSGICIVIK